MNKAYLSLGSNIDPERNLIKAVKLLENEVIILSKSKVWETEAVGSPGPDFLNQVVLISTSLSAEEIKEKIISKIENKLGRVRTNDKNAPRTIDLDVIIFNQEILEENIWSETYLALPLAELCPDLKQKGSELKLEEIAQKLKTSSKNKIFK